MNNDGENKRKNKVIINFVPKIQAIDKCVATIAEIKRQGYSIDVVTLISLKRKGNADLFRSCRSAGSPQLR